MADPATPKPTSSVKLVLLGEAAVGKSSLVLRFVNNDFQENKEPTIGTAFLTQKCALPSRTIKFEIWDTAGQERFASLAPMYYRNAQAALVAYDVTKSSSLVKARHWVAELQRQASPGIVIALVGNKLDLVDGKDGGQEGTQSQNKSGDAAAEEEGDGREGPNSDETTTPASGQSEQAQDDDEDDGPVRKISTEEARAFAEEEALLFYETSARTGQNVTEVFTAIAGAIPESALRGRGAGGGQGAGGTPGSGGAGQGGAGGSDRGRDRVDLGRAAEGGKGDACQC